MYYLGVDLGSTTGKAVVISIDDEQPDIVYVEACAIEPAGTFPEQTAKRVIAMSCGRAGIPESSIARACATGYGRESLGFIGENKSEITCHAKGAHLLNPACRTIIDVGGQDVKVIALNSKGAVADFAMNDKCAAGTGKFFEAMAHTLRTDVQGLGTMALQCDSPVPISSTCSVFAESEVITAINKQLGQNNIAGGIHESIARRLAGMTQRVGVAQDIVVTGGCAKNPALRVYLERMLEAPISVLPCDPQINGALGAALIAAGGKEYALGAFRANALDDKTTCR